MPHGNEPNESNALRGISVKGCRPGIFKKMKFFIAETRILNIFES